MGGSWLVRGLPRGSARLYGAAVVGLVGVVIALALLGGLGRPTTTGGSPLPSGALTPFQNALQGINDDGTFSRDTALEVFAAAFGPLPGVAEPAPDSSYRSGTAALQMVQAYWNEITGAQRTAIKGYLGTAADAVIPAPAGAVVPAAASGSAGGESEYMGQAELVAYRPALFATYQQLADQAAADIAPLIGHPLGVPIRTEFSPAENDGAWAWASGNWGEVAPGSPATGCVVSIPPSTANDSSRTPYLRWLLLHEVWHCFQGVLVDVQSLLKVPKWISEGEASWVAEAITGGAGAPPPEKTYWEMYLLDPGTSLYSRTYDGVGFFAQLAQAAIDPWTVLEPTYRAGAGGSDPGFVASGANNPTFTDRWGSSWLRDGSPSNAWAMTAGFGIPPISDRATSQFFQIGDGDSDQISAKPVSAAIADIHATAFVTRFEVPAGSGRVGDLKAAGLDRVVRGATLDVCTNPGGCLCPSGGGLGGSTPPSAGPSLRAAATGEQHVTSIVQFRGISKTEWCGPSSQSPQKPCQTECGGSNGDPHLRTVSGQRYDLQATGEYVLLRSPDASIELQARQEAPSCSTGQSCGVTINTAIAGRVNGHRVGFYATDAEPVVMIDGTAIDADAVGGADIGPAARLTAYQRGYQLDLPDGSKVWALSLGASGINLLVLPSDSLRSSGVGIIGAVPANAGFRVPPLPDGSALPVPLDRQDRWHLLYEVFAPAWRVTPESSLFDYDEGQTTETFVVAGFPTLQAPQTIDEVDPAALSTARTSCAGVADPDLADECAFDVATTGSTEYVTLYTVTDDFQSRGPIALSPQEPTPTPGGGGGVPSGIVLVGDHLTGATEARLSPDGTVYVEVAEQEVAFGDVTIALLALDGRSGAVKKRAVAVTAGRLAWAAGSIWAGEFQRGDFGCQVSRLDPTTLAVTANVTTVCFDGQTVLVAHDDAPWFIDPTGAGANGEGAHLQRIDPATNKLDTTPSGRIELPFANSFLGRLGFGSVLATTSDGVFFGERHDGLFRVNLDGSVDPLDAPGFFGMFPSGRGVWTQTEIGTFEQPEGTAGFYTGASTPDLEVGLNGDLIGADDGAIYASFSEDDDQADGFWRFPIDGGPPERLATSGFVPTAFGGQMRLLYRDLQGPLLIGDGLAVKLWIAPSPTDTTQSALLFQSIPLP